MTDYVKAWQCIGCGRIESQANCIGICQDRLETFVPAAEHQAEIEKARHQLQALTRIVRQLAWSSPRAGEWERSYRALQTKARNALHDMEKA